MKSITFLAVIGVATALTLKDITQEQQSAALPQEDLDITGGVGMTAEERQAEKEKRQEEKQAKKDQRIADKKAKAE